MKIMIGYDGSPSARDAILELHRAGLPGDTQAVVVTCADVSPSAAAEVQDPPAEATGSQRAPIVRQARGLVEQAINEARDWSEAGCALVKEEFPTWSVTCATFAGSPYGELIKPAAEGVPDLIVVGSQGRSALGRLVLGSVSQNVLTHAPCSVRISRRPPAGSVPRGGAVRIVIGIDGSSHSALAVTAVAGRVWPAGTEVKVIAALDVRLMSVLASPMPSPWARPWMDVAPVVADARDWARQAVSEVAAELQSAGLAATTLVEVDDPKRLLLQEAERWGADCIFLGAKGHSRLERFLLGSVSSTVAARAACSVEVVRQIV